METSKWSWQKLRAELIRRQNNDEPVETTIRHVANWIKEVGPDYVILLSEQSRTSRPRPITSAQIDACSPPHQVIKYTLRTLLD